MNKPVGETRLDEMLMYGLTGKLIGDKNGK